MRSEQRSESVVKPMNRLTRAGSAALFLTAVCLAMTVYFPHRQKRLEVDREIAAVRARLNRQEAVYLRLRLRRDALAMNDPLELEEAIREGLRKGQRGEYIIEDR